jgi:hypothetical protein
MIFHHGIYAGLGGIESIPQDLTRFHFFDKAHSLSIPNNDTWNISENSFTLNFHLLFVDTISRINFQKGWGGTGNWRLEINTTSIQLSLFLNPIIQAAFYITAYDITMSVQLSDLYQPGNELNISYKKIGLHVADWELEVNGYTFRGPAINNGSSPVNSTPLVSSASVDFLNNEAAVTPNLYLYNFSLIKGGELAEKFDMKENEFNTTGTAGNIVTASGF